MNMCIYTVRWYRPVVPDKARGYLSGDFEVGQIMRESREEIFRYLTAASDWPQSTIYEVRLERAGKRTLQSRCMSPQLEAWKRYRTLMPDSLPIELPVSRSKKIAEVLGPIAAALDRAVELKLLDKALAEDICFRLRSLFERSH